jgi:hypothetical protein
MVFALALILPACATRNANKPTDIGIGLAPPPYTHAQAGLGSHQGSTTHDIILTTLRESLSDMPADTTAQRQVIVDLAYPASAEEFNAMGGWTLLLLSATSHDSAELPLKRAYVRVGEKLVDLQQVSGSKCSTLPPEEDALIRAFGPHRCDALYYLPVVFTLMPIELLVDFATVRSEFIVTRFPMSSSHGSLPSGIDLEAPIGVPSPDAAEAFAKREFPLVW